MHFPLGRGRHVMMRGRHVLPRRGGSIMMFDKEITPAIVGNAFREVGRDMLGRDGRGQRQGNGMSNLVVSRRKPLVFKK